jgi:putative SOS response-associated peptidase YedK
MCGRFSLYKISEIMHIENLKPRYNIAPTQEAAVIVDGKGALMKWGIEFSKPVINTRVETWTEKPFFHQMKRILVPSDGFYEWKGGVPYRLETGSVFYFAGLTFKDRFSILTMPASKYVEEIHDRMPAVLNDKEVWVAEAKLDVVDRFKSFKVSTLVNSPKNDSADILLPA